MKRFFFVWLRHNISVTTPASGHPLEATPPFSSSLGITKARFASALTRSSNLIEGEFKLLFYLWHQSVDIPRSHRQQNIGLMLLDKRNHLVCSQ